MGDGRDLPAGCLGSEIRSVSFVPIDRSGRTDVVMLFYRSQVGPIHETEWLAMVCTVRKVDVAWYRRAEGWPEGFNRAGEMPRRLTLHGDRRVRTRDYRGGLAR